MDYRARLERLHAAMVDNGLDALIYGTGANFQYFTGLPVQWCRMEEPEEPEFLLVFPRDDSPRVLAPSWMPLELKAHTTVPVPVDIVESREEARDRLRELLSRRVSRAGHRLRCGAGAGTLPDASFLAGTSSRASEYIRTLVTQAVPGAECIDAEALGESLRLVKDEEEIALLRRVAALTGRVMEMVVDSIRPGITQPELEDRVIRAGLALGAEDVSFSPAALFVKSGTEAGENPFLYPREKGLVPGSSVAFDFGFLMHGYCSDFGRSFYCGPAPKHISGAYRALQQSMCALMEQMKPGRVMLGSLFGIMEAEMDRRGYGDHLRARLKDGTLGHQIGVDLHENPWIRPGCEVVLQPSMVMALEPKAWLPGEYYLRVEDIVLVTDNGAEPLTSFDRDLFELPA